MDSNNIGEPIVAVIETFSEDGDKYDTDKQMPEKIAEISAAGYKDRTKRRLSLPISGSRKSSIVSTDGSCTEKESGKVKRKNSTRRDSNVSCSSWSDSFTDYESDEDNENPRIKNQKASNGFTDFCVRSIDTWKFGRLEIEFAENEMEGLLKLREKVIKNDILVYFDTNKRFAIKNQ